MERTSSIRRKAMARQHKGEVMIAGEQLRYERERVFRKVQMLNINDWFLRCRWFSQYDNPLCKYPSFIISISFTMIILVIISWNDIKRNKKKQIFHKISWLDSHRNIIFKITLIQVEFSRWANVHSMITASFHTMMYLKNAANLSGSLELNLKVEASWRETDQGQTLPPAHLSKLLRGTGTYRLACEP